MKNMMKTYLGRDYSNNHLRNFCLYWLKGMACRPAWEDTDEAREAFDKWRKENDLDCLYFDGDLCADTLMSAWTIIKWVAEFLNRENGRKFTKCEKDLKLLAEDRDAYLPPENELVKLLDRFLELAELPCNYILLPDRNMNNDRYCFRRSVRFRMFYDQIPATLWHVFEKETLGVYFLDEEGNVDEEKVTNWIRREKLEMGFRKKVLKQSEVIPLTKEISPRRGKMLTKESELREALTYMIRFLEQRRRALNRNKATDKAVARLNKVFDILGPYGGMIETHNPRTWWTLCCDIYDETEMTKTMAIYMSGGEFYDYVMDPRFFVTAKLDGGKIVEVTIESFSEWTGFSYEHTDKGLRKLFSEFMNSICEHGPYLTSPKAVYRTDKNGDMKRVRLKKRQS